MASRPEIILGGCTVFYRRKCRAGWPLHDFSMSGKKTLFKYSVVSLAAREGVLSFMKTMFFRNGSFFFLYHRTRCFFRKSMYTLAVILTPSETLNGPNSSLPMIAAQNITPLLHCWRLIRSGRGTSLQYHPLIHPSGASRVARHSSVNKTL